MNESIETICVTLIGLSTFATIAYIASKIYSPNLQEIMSSLDQVNESITELKSEIAALSVTVVVEDDAPVADPEVAEGEVEEPAPIDPEPTPEPTEEGSGQEGIVQG